VKLNDLLMGGGFGRRGNRDLDFIMDAVMLSKEVGRPVKVIWTREDDVHNGRFRPISAHYLRAGLDTSGKMVAWHHRVAVDRIGPYYEPVLYQRNGGRDNVAMLGGEPRGYDVPHQLVEHVYRDTGVRTNPLRGISFLANKFAAETFIDEIAGKRGIDPLAFRLELLKNTPRAYKAVERVTQMAEWGRKRDGRALGLAYIDYSGSQVAGVAELSLDRASGQIKLHNFWCTIDCGIAVQPDNVVAQTESSIVYGIGVALSERISIKNGVVEQSNFYDYRVPRMNEVPPMHIEVIQTENHPTVPARWRRRWSRPRYRTRSCSLLAFACVTRRSLQSESRRRWPSLLGVSSGEVPERPVSQRVARAIDLQSRFWERASLRRNVDHQTFIPPSATMSAPVMYELSLDAKNRATLAISSGRPSRPSSVFPSIALAQSGSLSCSTVWLVSMRPGEIELARMPCVRPSMASCLVMAMIPALEVVWASEPRFLKLNEALSDAMFTITP
jgi:hypothetical protein